MKNRRIIFLAACMCSVVFLSGCSTDSLMDKMMGTETTVSSSASVDISKEDSDAVHVDANLEKPVFSVNPVESLQIPVGNTSGKLTCEAGITGEGTVTYQWSNLLYDASRQPAETTKKPPVTGAFCCIAHRN